MANFKMLYLGRCWALRSLCWLHVAPGGTSESTTAALGVPDHRTRVAWKFGPTITKIVRSLSHLSWLECMKANELTSSAPKTSGWRPARAEPARMMTIPPSKLAATTSAPQFLSSHNETALCSSLTETHPLHPYPRVLQANTLPWQTSKRSSSVDAGLFGG